MRALTLTQPWAGLVASGIKRVENRSRHMIKREDFGKPFAIHAGSVIEEMVYDRIIELAPELDSWDRPNEPWYRLSRITGAVIAVATVDKVLDPRAHGIGTAEPAASAPLEDDQRRWFFGPIGYVLRDIVALNNPVRCPGKQPFWHLAKDIEEAVMQNLAAQ